jgi:hypothetical protein
MSDNVITHAKFATAERLKELQEQGVVIVEETRDYTDLTLPEPQYGEEIVGSLGPDEKALFFALYDAQMEMEDKTRNLMGNQISRVGETVRNSDRSKDITEALRDQEMGFDTDEEAVQFFRLQKKVSLLHSTFHWNIAERLNAHEYVLGVRSQGRIVKVQRRW